jgi:hypothetical protein
VDPVLGLAGFGGGALMTPILVLASACRRAGRGVQRPGRQCRDEAVRRLGARPAWQRGL